MRCSRFPITLKGLLLFIVVDTIRISVLSFVSRYSHFELQIATFRLLTASLLQAMRSTGYAASFIVRWSYKGYQSPFTATPLPGTPRHSHRLQIRNDTYRSHLVRPKDTVNPSKQDGVVYMIPVNAVKSTSGKQGDQCMKESKSTTGIYDSPVPRPPPFLNTPTSPAINHFGTR